MDGCLPVFNLRDSLLLAFFHIPFYYLGEKPFSLGLSRMALNSLTCTRIHLLT